VCSDDAAKGGVTIMFVRRANYKRRPGHNGDLETRLFNEDEISQGLHTWAKSRPGGSDGSAAIRACNRLTQLRLIAIPHGCLLDTAGVTVVDAWLEKMTMLEQLQLVQKSCIMIGAHGYGPASLACRLCACVSHGPSSCVFLMHRAGVSHVLFARPGTQLIEIRIPQYRRPHFISYSKIAGVGWIDMTPSGL
jgi:hypothetical protein